MADRKKKKGRAERKGFFIDAAMVLRIFREQGKPLGEKDLMRLTAAPNSMRKQLYAALGDLEEAGRIIKIGHSYGLAESMNLVSGRLEIQRSGVGFVIPDDKRRKDIFINPRDMGDAWHGDYVACAITRVRKNKSNEGRVARIIERGRKSLSCRVVKRMGQYMLCRPTDSRQQMSFMAGYDKAALGAEPRVDDVVDVIPGDKLEYRLYAGTVTALFGQQEDVGVQERLVKLNHNIPTEFPSRVLSRAEELPEVPDEADFAGRRDLRAEDFVTIDGAKARDFDDAVLVKPEGKGFRLWVAIADVSHYVPQGGALDREALERGNSYYFPQSVEPMFPERLSNGLCSLNPGVPRLSMVAEMVFTNKGIMKDAVFYPAVIESKARLTYAQTARALIEKDPAEREAVKHVLPMLESAEKLARAINALRIGRGGLDFDLPEPEIHFNLYGEAIDIRPRVRNFAHQIIEEFMIAANEAVAAYLTEQGVPLLYRIHPDPDPSKLENLFALLKRTELAEKIPLEAGPSDLPAILLAAEGTDLAYLVSRLALRCMMQASYSPNHEGHYGLASPCYCHFTSPIRRYADLVVHRALKLALTGDGASAANAGRLQKVADHLSKRERAAMEAEREILKRVTILFLGDKVGQRFTGVINSVADFGFWVELTEVMAEGMVRLSSLGDDYYALFPERQELVGERTGRVLRLGMHVEVELTHVDLGRLEVDLALVSGGLRGEGAADSLRKADRDGSERTAKSGQSARSSRSSRSGQSSRSARSNRSGGTGGSGGEKQSDQPGQPGQPGRPGRPGGRPFKKPKSADGKKTRKR